MISRLIIQTAPWLAALAMLLFVPAGTAGRPAARVFLAEMGVLGLVVGQERTLAVELEGYAEYAARVRYRLIPLIW